MANGLTEKSRLSLPLTVAISLLVSAVTGTGAAVTSAYSLRDQTMEAVEQRIEKTAGQLRHERGELLSRYLSREAFAEWRQNDRIRQDANFYRLLNAIERLSEQIKRR